MNWHLIDKAAPPEQSPGQPPPVFKEGTRHDRQEEGYQHTSSISGICTFEHMFFNILPDPELYHDLMPAKWLSCLFANDLMPAK